MNKLTFELKKLCATNRDGSHATQADRWKQLRQISDQLADLGFKNMGVRSLKTRHINTLIQHWKTEVSAQSDRPISVGTIKNRLSVLRWWAAKINKQNVIPRTNKELGIEDRKRLPETNKAYRLNGAEINQLPRYLQLSLRLQQAFGLRREESAKFVPSRAIQSNSIHIEASWAKGGRARTIPVATDEQRALVDDLKTYPREQSLIPSSMSYRQYLSHRSYQISLIELKNTHGLRHHYAQARYRALTNGIKPPRVGGTKTTHLSATEKALDHAARLIISNELGHGRIEITKVYLG